MKDIDNPILLSGRPLGKARHQIKYALKEAGDVIVPEPTEDIVTDELETPYPFHPLLHEAKFEKA